MLRATDCCLTFLLREFQLIVDICFFPTFFSTLIHGILCKPNNKFILNSEDYDVALIQMIERWCYLCIGPVQEVVIGAQSTLCLVNIKSHPGRWGTIFA